MNENSFGGRWTEEKLSRLRKYLEAYTAIFTKNPKASFFHRVYVDAFAGTGLRRPRETENNVPDLFMSDEDALQFMKGSARVALDISPPFDKYFFVENNKAFANELVGLRDEYSALSDRIFIQSGDANRFLVDWADELDTRHFRAVVFLDPFGMSVEWTTLEALAKTQAVDLWILFPLGQAVNRLLTRRGLPPPQFEARLTKFFGTPMWKEEFYTKSSQTTMFEDQDEYDKSASFDQIGRFFNSRLESIFAKVAPRPLVLMNSKNNPIFLLCFAASNPRGATTAVNIANDLLQGPKATSVRGKF